MRPFDTLQRLGTRFSFEFSAMIAWLIILAVSIATGQIVLRIGETFLVITLYGGFLLLRKIVQQGFALRHNTATMRIVREPIIGLMKELYPKDQEWLDHLFSRHITYDDFRLYLREAYADILATDAKWRLLRALALVRQQTMLQINQPEFRMALFNMITLRYNNDIEWQRGVFASECTNKIFVQAVRDRHAELSDTLTWYQFLLDEHIVTLPKVGITVPIFQVNLDEIRELIRTTQQQSFLGIDSVELSFNGTLEKWPEMNRILGATRRLVTKYNARRDVNILFNVQVLNEAGKRDAMLGGFRANIRRMVDVVFNIDSDTILDIDAISNAISVLIARPEVVCLTGDVRVINALVNFLTRMTAMRYFYAFNVERAAQSFFNMMTCMSGPFLVIRAENLNQIMETWAGQRFLGLKCTYGDDRHLTTLCLIMRWASIFVADCIVWTDSPVSMPVWVRQQLRWNKSAYRENYELVTKGYRNLNWFIKWDLFYLTFFPFLVLGVIIIVFARSVRALLTVSPLASLEILIPYIVTILVVNFLFQSLYGMIIKRDWKYIFSVAYVVLWFRHLIWLKVWALIRLKDTGWGTRTVEDQQKETDA